MLTRLATALRTIGRGSSEESLDRIRAEAPSVDPVLRKIVERTPGATLKVVTDLVLELSEQTSDPALATALVTLGTDPRNFREAAATLERLDRLIANHPVRGKIERGLEILEEHGALGLVTLEGLARFLVSVKRRPDQLRQQPGEILRAGDAILDIGRIVKLKDALGEHSVLWGRRAGFEAMNEGFGALTEPVPWTRLEGTLPGAFASADAIEIFKSWRMAKLPKNPTEIDKENARRLYFGVYALNKLVQPEWWARFQPDFVWRTEVRQERSDRGARSVEGDSSERAGASENAKYDPPSGPGTPAQASHFGAEPTDRVSESSGAYYDPPSRSIVLGPGLAPISAVIEALLNAVDHNFIDYRMFASEAPGHPIEIFVGMLEPLYGPGSRRELFARFAEHYLRIYLNQLGETYAPIESDGDPGAARVAALSKTFMDAMVEAQTIDLADEIRKHGALEQHNVGASGATAAVMLAAGAELLPL